MTEGTLTGRRVFVAEDDYLIADELRGILEESGAEVVGPVPTVQDALDLLSRSKAIDGAVLDINLRGEMSYSVADALLARGVPFMFITGYERTAIPPRFADAWRCEKPAEIDAIAQALGWASAPSARL